MQVVKRIMSEYLEREQAHPSRQLEEDAVLDSVSSHLGVQHGDQAGQRGCTTAHTHTRTHTHAHTHTHTHTQLQLM